MNKNILLFFIMNIQFLYGSQKAYLSGNVLDVSSGSICSSINPSFRYSEYKQSDTYSDMQDLKGFLRTARLSDPVKYDLHRVNIDLEVPLDNAYVMKPVRSKKIFWSRFYSCFRNNKVSIEVDNK